VQTASPSIPPAATVAGNKRIRGNLSFAFSYPEQVLRNNPRLFRIFRWLCKLSSSEQKLSAIRLLCARHQVNRLGVFDSVLTDDFAADSDVDFLYEFDEDRLTPDEELDHLLAMIAGLQQLPGRRVDFGWHGGLSNPYFKAEVDKQKHLVHEQKSGKVLV
jgi:predicted nucleotidyltransferase